MPPGSSGNGNDLDNPAAVARAVAVLRVRLSEWRARLDDLEKRLTAVEHKVIWAVGFGTGLGILGGAGLLKLLGG